MALLVITALNRVIGVKLAADFSRCIHESGG